MAKNKNVIFNYEQERLEEILQSVAPRDREALKALISRGFTFKDISEGTEPVFKQTSKDIVRNIKDNEADDIIAKFGRSSKKSPSVDFDINKANNRYMEGTSTFNNFLNVGAYSSQLIDPENIDFIDFEGFGEKGTDSFHSYQFSLSRLKNGKYEKKSFLTHIDKSSATYDHLKKIIQKAKENPEELTKDERRDLFNLTDIKIDNTGKAVSQHHNYSSLVKIGDNIINKADEGLKIISSSDFLGNGVEKTEKIQQALGKDKNRKIAAYNGGVYDFPMFKKLGVDIGDRGIDLYHLTQALMPLLSLGKPGQDYIEKILVNGHLENYTLEELMKKTGIADYMKANGGTQHEADFDAEGMARVYEKFYEEIPESAYANLFARNSVLEKGSVSVAKRSSFRKTTTDFKASPTGKKSSPYEIKNKEGEEFNGLMFADGGVYQYVDTVITNPKNNDGLLTQKWVNLETGETTYLTDTKEGLQNTVSSIFGNKFGTRSEYEGDLKEKAIGTALNTVYELEAQLELLKNPNSKKFSEEQRKRHGIVKDYIKANQERLTHAVSLIRENTDLLSVKGYRPEANLLLKTILGIGDVTTAIENPSQVGKIIKSMPGRTANQIKKNYEKFIMNSKDLGASDRDSLLKILKEMHFTDLETEDKNSFYAMNSAIYSAIEERKTTLKKPRRFVDRKTGDYISLQTTDEIKQNFERNKDFFAKGTKESVKARLFTLYKALEVINPSAAKALSGKYFNEFTENLNLKHSKSGKQIRKAEGFSGRSFVKGTAGWYLEQIILASEKQKMGLHVRPSVDGTSLELSFYDAKNIKGANVTDENGNLTLDKNHTATFNVPLVNSEGVITYNNGMRRMNNMHPVYSKISRYTAPTPMSLKYTTLNEDIWENVLKMVSQENLPEGWSGETFADYLIKLGDVAQATSLGKNIVRKALESTPSGGSYNVAQEVESQTKDGANVEQRLLRGGMIPLRSLLENIYSTFYYDAEDEQMQTMSNEQMMNMMKYITLRQRGAQDSILKTKDELGNTINNAELDFIKRNENGVGIIDYLDDLASKLPYLSYEDLKEESFTSGYVSAIGSRIIEAFGDLNDMSTRHLGQGDNYITRSKKAVNLLKKFKTEKGNFLKSQGKAYALYEDPFVSGHLTSYMENSLAQEKNQRFLYNVGYINDTMIKQRIDAAIAEPSKFGLTQGQVEELKRLNLPSVYEGGHIMPEKLMDTFEGYRTNFHAMSKDSEWSLEFLELLQNNGIDDTLLGQMKDGDYLPFADKDTQGIKLDKNLLLGKPPKKTKGFEAAEGSIIHGIKYENGVYKINMTDFLETHQGSKNVGASGLRVTTNSVADWIFDIMAGGNKNIDILTETPGLATKNFKQIVGDRYTYLINLARGAGISDDVIQKAIGKTQVFKNYARYNQDKKKWETFAEINERGQWVDKSGNLLLPDENTTRAFVSGDMDVLIKELGLEQYDENIYRDYVSQTALNRMNEYPYYTATGLLDPNEASAKGGVKVDEKLFQGFLKQVDNAETATGENFDLLRNAWQHMVDKVAGGSDERKEAFKIQRKYIRALTENEGRLLGANVDDSKALRVIFDNEMQERELSDNSVLLSDLLAQKNAGEMSAENTTYDNLLTLANKKGASKIVLDLGEGRQIEYGDSGEFLSQITAPLIDFNYVDGEKTSGEYIQKLERFLRAAAERDSDGNYKDLTKSANELLSQMANSAFHKDDASFKKRGSRYVSMASVSPSFTANVGDIFLNKLGGGTQNESIANFVNSGNRVLMSPEKLRAMLSGDSLSAMWTRQLIHMDLTGEIEKGIKEEEELARWGIKDTKSLLDAFIQGKLNTDSIQNEKEFKKFLSGKSSKSSEKLLNHLLAGYNRSLFDYKGDKKIYSEKEFRSEILKNFEFSGGVVQKDWLEQLFKNFDVATTVTEDDGTQRHLKRNERINLLWSEGVHKTTGQSFREYNQTLIDDIVNMVTVENFVGKNGTQIPKGIASAMMRYPEITGLDTMLIDFYVSNQLKGELAPYVASIGLAEFMNADQDGDKLNGFVLFYNSIKNSSMAGKTLQQLNKIKEMTSTATKIRSVARIKGANEDAENQTGNLEWTDEAIAKFHKELNPITNLQIATISKANKEYVGYLSNISTTMRKVMDLAGSELHERWKKGDISRGQLLENQYENLLLGGFFEMYEQDSISAKKVIERALKNPDFDYASESKALYELTNLLKSFDVKKDSTRTAKWSQIIKKSEELGFFKTDEAGNVIMKNRQFLNALARISSSYQQVMKTTTDEAEKTRIKEYLRSEDVGLGWLIGEKDGEDGVAQKMLATIGEDEFGNVRNIDDDMLAQFEKEGIAIRPNQVIKVFENMEKTISAMTGGLSLTQSAQKLRYIPQLGMSKTTEKNLAKNIGKYENITDLIKWEDFTKAIQLDSEIIAYAVELDDKNNAHDYLHSEFDPRYAGKDKESRKIKTGAGTKTYSITQLGDLIFGSGSEAEQALKPLNEHFKKIGETIFNIGGKDIDYDTLLHQAAVNENKEAKEVINNAISSKYLKLAETFNRSGDSKRWGTLYWSQVSSREGTLKHKAFELAEKLQKEKKITATNGEWFNSLFRDSEGNATSEYTELENLIKTSNYIIDALGFSQKFNMDDISKIVNTYMNTKSSLGLGDAALTEFSMGATFKIGDETVDILGTMDALLTEGQNGFAITDFKNKNEGHPEIETWQLSKLRELLIKTLEDSMLTQEEFNRMQSNDFTNLDEKQQNNLKRKIGLYKKLEEVGIVDDKQKTLIISDLIDQQRMQILQFMKPGGKANKSSYYKMARRLFGTTDKQIEELAIKSALNAKKISIDDQHKLSSEDPYSIRTFNEMGEDISYDTYSVHNEHMYYYDDNGELKSLKQGQSNFEQILEAFTLSDTVLKKSKEKLKLKERLAFLGEDGTLVGNTFVGQQKKINLAQIQDGLIEQFGEMANVPKLKGVIHTHTNGSSVFSLEDIQSFKENELFKDTDLFYLFNGKELVTMNLEGLDEKQRKDFFEEYEQAYQDKKEEILKSEDFKQFLDRRKQKTSVDESVDETKIATEIESEIFEDFLAEDDNVFNIETLFPANSASNNRIGRHKLKEIANQANQAYDLAQLANKNFVQGTIMGAQFMGQQTPAIIDKSIESTKSDIANFDNLVAEQVEKIQPNDTSIKTIGEFFNKLDIPNLKKVAESFSELSNIEPINSDTTLKTKEDILSHLTNIGAETKNIKAEDLTEELRTELTEKASMTEAYKRLQNKEGYFDKSGRFVDKPLLADELKELENNQEQASKLLDKHKAKNNMRDVWKNIKDLDAKGELTETEALTREYLENLYNDMIKGYAAGIGVDVENKGDVNTVKKDLEKQFKSQENMNTEETNKATKTAISDLQTLQQMLSQNAPNQFTKSITGDLGDMLSKLKESERSFDKLVGQLSTEQKVQIQQGILNSVDQSLGTIRSADQGIMQMEDQMKHASPLHQKLMQGRINQLNLQKAGEQANIDRQLAMTDGTDLHKQIKDRQELTRVMTEQTKAYNKEHGAIDKNMAKMSQFGQSVKGMLATSFQYGVVYRGAQSVIQQIYTIIGSIQEFDALMTQLRMINGAGEDITANMIAGYKQLGDEMGLTTQEVTATAVTFLRQGRSIADTNELMRQSAILAKTAFMDQNQAAELLTSTLNGFKLEAKDAAKVIDLVAYTDTMTATSADELMTAFQYVASSADTAGIEVEKLNAMIATSSEATRLSAQMIGTAYKTIVSRLQQVKVGSLVDAETGEDISNVDKMLKQYGLTVMDVNGKMKDGDQILSEFAELWNSWGNDTAKKREAVEALAGTRQGNIAMSLFENWDRYEEILSETEANAAGSASKKMDVAKESIQTSLAQLQNAMKAFGSSEWATDAFKWIIDLGTGLAKLLPVILLVGGAWVTMGNGGSRLTTLYQVQTNLINKLKMSMLGLVDAEKMHNLQAQNMIKNSQMQTFTQGNRTAFFDPKTGQITEQMDNATAASKMAIYNENTYRDAMQKAGIITDGKFVDNSNSQLGLYEGIFNGRAGDATEAGKTVGALREQLDLHTVKGNLTDVDRSKVLRYSNYLVNSGEFSPTEAKTRLEGMVSAFSGETVDQDLIKSMDSVSEGFEYTSDAQQQVDTVKAFNIAIDESVKSVTAFSDALKIATDKILESSGKKSTGNVEDENSKMSTAALKKRLQKNKNKLATITEQDSEEYKTTKEAIDKDSQILARRKAQRNIDKRFGLSQEEKTEDTKETKTREPQILAKDAKKIESLKAKEQKINEELETLNTTNEAKKTELSQKQNEIKALENKGVETSSKINEYNNQGNALLKEAEELKNKAILTPQEQHKLRGLENQAKYLKSVHGEDLTPSTLTDKQKADIKAIKESKGSFDKQDIKNFKKLGIQDLEKEYDKILYEENQKDMSALKAKQSIGEQGRDLAVSKKIEEANQAFEKAGKAQDELTEINEQASKKSLEAQKISDDIAQNEKDLAKLKDQSNQASMATEEAEQQANMRATASEEQETAANQKSSLMTNLKGMGNNISNFAQQHQKGWQAGGMVTGMVGMMGASQGISTLTSGLGMSSATSSLLGMAGGMGTMMLPSILPVVGPFISAGIGIVGTVFSAMKQHEEERHQEVMNNIKEASDAYKNHQSKLKEIDDQEFKNEFERLSQGVDENGQNVSLSDEEYENYQSAVEKLTDGHEELIKGYNEEGQAIVDRDKILKESIKLTKEQIRLDKQKMYGEEQLKNQGDDFNTQSDQVRDNVINRNILGTPQGDFATTGIIKLAGVAKNLDSFKNLEEYERILKIAKDPNAFLEEYKGYSNSEIVIKDIEETIYKNKDNWQQAYKKYEKELQQIDAQRKTQWKGYVETHQGVNWEDDQIAFMGDLIDNYKGEEFRNLSENSKFYGILDNYANMINDTEVYGALKTFNQDKDSLAISELRTRQKAVLDATSSYNLTVNDKEALGLTELDKVEAEFKQKLAGELGEGSEKYNAIVANIENTNLANLKNLNSNFKKLMVDDVITSAKDGVEVLTSAIGQLVAQAEKLEDVDFGDKVDITWQTKNTEGLTNLMDLVKNYRENDKVMSPEILKGLEEIKSTYNLTPVEMDKALANEQGIWELNTDNVKNLMSTMLLNALEDNENYSFEDLQMLSQNAEYLGIKGVDQLGFGEILTKFIDKGFLIANAEGITTDGSSFKFETNKQEELYKKAIETDVYKNNIEAYKEYARTANLEDKGNILSQENLAEKFNFANGTVTEFTSELKSTIEALGGFTTALDKFSAVDLINNEMIMKKFASGNITGFASDVKDLTGDDFGDATDDQIAALGLGYLEREKAKYQLQLDQLNSTEFKDSALAGMIEKEGRDAKRAEEDAKQKWNDLLKEARLSKLKLDIDLVQIGLDKLNKTASTLASTMDLLSEKDGVGRFDLLIQQLSTVNELSGDLNAEWNRLEEALTTAETGEEQQAIVEQMSAISDSMTESATKQIQLEKELNDTLANSFSERISNMKSIVDRELSLLDAQKKKTDSNQFIFYNPNAIGLFGTLKRDKTEYEKRRSETQKIIEDEKKRQEAITKLRKESTQNIYEDEKTRREREIKRAEEDWQEAWDKIGDTTAEGMKTAASNAIAEIESYITAFNEAGHTLNVNGEVTFNGNSVQQAKDHMKQAQQRSDWNGGEKLNADDWGAINTLRDQALKGDINPLKKVRQTRNTMEQYGVSKNNAEGWLDYKLKTDPLFQADTYLKVNGNEIDFAGQNSFKLSSGATIYNGSWATDTEKTSSDQLVGKYFFDSKNNNRGYIESQNEAGSFRVVYANGIIKEGVKREDLKTKDMYFITYQDMINHVNAQKNDIGTPYGNKLATTIINNTNSRISKIAGEKADEWLFHGDGSVERLEYKQGGTVIPSDTEVAGSRYTDQLDDVLLRDKGTSGGNKIANLFNNKDNFVKIFEESLKEISNEVEDKTSEKGSSNTDNLWLIIHEALKDISEEERTNKEDILSDTESINQDIKANETKTKDDIYNKTVSINDSIIKNTEEFSGKFKTVFDKLVQNLLTLGDASNLITEASKYIGQNNSTGKFSDGRIEEWCADFVSYVLDEVGVSLDKVPRSPSVETFYNSFVANNALTNNPSIGNLAIRDKSEHIAIVASVNGDEVVLIEGNTGNSDEKKSIVSRNTYSLNEMLKNGWEFGVYDKGIGSTNNKDLSHYGIMSEKKGEYKVDKKTGEWIYEPYETVVDTSKYDVISSKESQKIRSRQYDEGTPNATATTPDNKTIEVYIDSDGKTQTPLPIGTVVHTKGGDYKITGGTGGNYTSEFVETNSILNEIKQILEHSKTDSQYYSESFIEYLTEANRKQGEFLLVTAQRAKANGMDYNEYSRMISKYNDEKTKELNRKSIEEANAQIVEAQNMMYLLNEKLIQARLRGEDTTEFMTALTEAHDNYKETIEQFSETINNVVEEIKNNLSDELEQSLSHTTSAIINLKNELTELQHAASLMFETEFQSKILNGMSVIVNISDQIVASQNKLKKIEEAQINFKEEFKKGLEELVPGFWNGKGMDEAYAKIFNVDGTINELALEGLQDTIKSVYDVSMISNEDMLQLQAIEAEIKASKSDGHSGQGYIKRAQLVEKLSMQNNTSTDNILGYTNAIANLQAAVENDTKRYETIQEINSLEEQRFNQLNEIISLQKEALNTEKEERFSLLKAINSNNQLLSEMISLQSKLIREPNVTDKASNMREQYNQTLTLIESQEEYTDTLKGELENLIGEFKGMTVSYTDSEGDRERVTINPQNWMSANGEIIAKYFNRDLNALQKAADQAVQNGNEELAQRYLTAIASMELIAQTQGEYTTSVNELGNTLADAVAQQEEIIKQQAEWMKQYITELVSGLQYNINNNETLQSYISSMTDSYGQFDRDNKQLSNNTEIEVLQANSDSLLKKLSTLKEETAKIKDDIYDITGVDLGTLFSADGERHAYNYTKFTRELEENLRKGVITNNEYTDILAKLETYEEIVKEEVQTQDDIVKNYQEINSTIEEQIKLAIDSYNWQIKKQETLLSLKEKQFETENKIYRLRLDLDKELRSAKQTTQWLTESERRKIFNEERYTRLYQSLDEMESKSTAYAEEYYDQIMGLTEDTLYQQEYITNEYERRLALVEMEYNITKQKVDLEKKQMELANVLAEKNSRVYVNGEWRQVANMEDVKNASEEVADIEAELKLAEEERLQKIQSNQMQEYIDSLKKNQAALENSMNYTSDTNKELINKLSEFVGSIVGEDLNANSLNQTVRNTVTSISNFNQSLDILVDDTIKSAIDTLGTLKTSLEEKIKNYTDEVDNLKTQTETQNKRLEQANLDLFTSNSKLCDYLDDLSEKIGETIRKITRYENEEFEEEDGAVITNSIQDIFEAINEISYLKERAEDADKKGRQPGQEGEGQWNWSQEAVIPYRAYLDKNNYEYITEISKQLNHENFEEYRQELRNTDKTLKEATEDWVKERKYLFSDFNRIISLLEKAKDQQIKSEKEITEQEKAISEQDEKNTQRQTNNLAQETVNVLTHLNATEDFADIIDDYDLYVRDGQIYVDKFGVYIDEQGNIIDEFGKVIGKLPQSLTAIFDELIKKINTIFIYKKEEEEEEEQPDVIYRNGETYHKTGDGWYENEAGNKFVDTSGGQYAGWRTDSNGKLYWYNPANGYDSRNQKSSSGSTGSKGSTGSTGSKGSTGNGISNGVGFNSNTDYMAAIQNSNNKADVIALNDARNAKIDATGSSEKKLSSAEAIAASKAGKKATGERFTTEPIYNVDEIGKELIIPPIASGRYAAMEYGSQIVPHNLSENILKWGAINPASINANQPEFTSNLTNNAITYSIGTIKLDNVTNGENFIPELNRFLQRTTTLNNR